MLGVREETLTEDRMIHKIKLQHILRISFIDDEKQFLKAMTNFQEVEFNYFSKQKNNLH